MFVFLCAINIKSRVLDEVTVLSEYFFSHGLIFHSVFKKVPVDLPREMANTCRAGICVQFAHIKNTCLIRHNNCTLNKSQGTVNLAPSLLTVCHVGRNYS